MVGDMSSDEHEIATNLSIYGALFGITGIVGPILGGVLYDPAKLYPSLFSSAFFAQLPFALPGVFAASLHVGLAFVAWMYLIDPPKSIAHSKTSLLDSMKNPHLRSMRVLGPVALYCVTAFCHGWYISCGPMNLAHLGYSPRSTSLTLIAVSATKLPLQLYGFQKLLKYFRGLKHCFRVGLLFLLPLHVVLPLITIQNIAVSATSVSLLQHLVIVGCLIGVGIAEVLCYLSCLTMITDSVSHLPKEQQALGAIHGLASTCAALMRTLAPSIAGLVFQVGRSWTAFGVNALVFMLCGFMFSKTLEATPTPPPDSSNDFELNPLL
jgi:MFS family permease